MELVLKDNKGFTLVEVLIAMVVFLLISLAMMQTALVGIDSNMINVLRDEAVRIAEETMIAARNTPFDNLGAGDTTNGIMRDIRNINNFQYTVTRSITDHGISNKVVDINVAWNWKLNPYTHSITTILRRP